MHHEVKLMDIRTKEVFFDKLTYLYLEMPKFKKTEEELVTLLDKWLYAIKNLSSLMERPVALQEAVFKRLFEQAEIAAFNKEELHDYRESQKDFWDLNSVLETAERKGIEKGDRNRQISTAKSLKAMGILTDTQIAEATGLSEDEVKGLEVRD